MVSGMTTTLTESAVDSVTAWRLKILQDAGVGPDASSALAERHDIDLHKAQEMAVKGCPDDLLLRILL
jgi:hypothetical protein